MGNPLSHVGQSAHPEVSKQVQDQCEQAQSQAPGTQSQSQGQSQAPGPAEAPPQPQQPDDTGTPERPATRLPQHPLQHQDDPAERPGEQARIRQQGESRAEDTTLPSPTQAD